jgi:hypothetical protein
MYFALIFMAAIQLLVTSITTEKDRKIVEGMKMMGLMDSTYWVSWFMTQTIMNLLVIGVFLITMVAFDLTHHLDLSLLFVLMLLYSCVVITYSFLITSISSTPKIAGLLSMIFLIIGLGIYYLLFFEVWQNSQDGWFSITATLLGSLAFPVPLGQLGYYFGLAVITNGITTWAPSNEQQVHCRHSLTHHRLYSQMEQHHYTGILLAIDVFGGVGVRYSAVRLSGLVSDVGPSQRVRKSVAVLLSLDAAVLVSTSGHRRCQCHVAHLDTTTRCRR